MPFDQLETKRIENILEKFCKDHGPPPKIHDQLKWGFTVDTNKQTIELFEIRPYFMDKSKKINHPCAKAAYVKKDNLWKIYWMRGNLKWYRYQPRPEVKTVEEFLRVVKVDANSCFFG